MSSTFVYEASIQLCEVILNELHKQPFCDGDYLSWTEDTRHSSDGEFRRLAVQLREFAHLLYIDKGPSWHHDYNCENGQNILSLYLDHSGRATYLYSE